MLSDKGVHLEPPGFIWAKQEGPMSVLGSGASEPGTEGASSQLTPELLPAWDRPLSTSIVLSIHAASSLSLSFFHYPLYPRHFSLRPWPGLLLPPPTLDLLMSTMLALFTDHVHVCKRPLCSILSLFMNIHFTNRICS